MKNTFQLAFEITASCHQVCRIVDKEYTEERILKELREGLLATSTWINEGRATTIERIEDGHVVATVISQEINGDYENYR